MLSYPADMHQIRSKKFQLYSDEKIIVSLLDNPRGENLHFLQVEINIRGLEVELHKRQSESSTRPSHPPIYYLFYLLMFFFFLSRFLSQVS